MIRTLFVDDEPDVLEGLENRLRRLRRRWSMSFAVGGQRALEALERDPVDVVVSDMRMPGMDGAELLTRIRDKYPHIIRIILSGQTSQEQVLRALPVAHRFLSKPCDAKLLQAAVERARALQAIVQDERVLEVVGRVSRLPSLPSLYTELTDLMASPRTSAEDLGQVIERDIAMTARILQLVNSSYFGLSREVAGATEAVAYLGANTIRAIVLTEGLFGIFEGHAVLDGYSLQRVQRHSIRAATLASRLLDDAEEGRAAFSAAILHDVGSLVLATMLPEYYESALQRVRDDGVPLHQAEVQEHGFGHAEVGAALLTLWGLPYAVVEGVAHHHRPSRVQSSEFGVVGAVHVADRLIHELDSHHREPPTATGLDMDYLEQTNVVHRLDDWRAMARQLDTKADA